MNIMNRTKEPPIIITDVNGTIIRMNITARNEIPCISCGESIDSLIDVEYLKKLSMFNNRMDMTKPKLDIYKRAIVRVLGSGVTKTVEITMCYEATEGEDEIADKRLFAGYSQVAENEVIRKVNLEELAKKLVDVMQKDVRFAYRTFNVCSFADDAEIGVNFSHMSAIVALAIVTLNEIEYRKPINIVVDRILGDCALTVSVDASTFKNADGIHQFNRLYPRTAARMSYLAALCEKDEIKYDVKVSPNNAKIRFVLDNVDSKGKLMSYTIGQNEESYIASLLGMFVYSNDKSGVAQE